MTAVLDASALLAYVLDEPGGQIVEERLLNGGAYISASNWAETLSTLIDRGRNLDAAIGLLVNRGVLDGAITIVPLDDAQARRIAELRTATRPAGLSLADRACLALAETLDLPALTADRAWGTVQLSVQVRLIR